MSALAPTLAEVFDRISVSNPTTWRNLTALPLIARHAAEPDYLTLDEALRERVVTVREVSEHGSVPEVLLRNDSPQPVLVLEGEEIVGAKQNRVANVTVMVAPKSETVIPVSCVEAGRWHQTSAGFSSSGRAHFARGRAAKVDSVTQFLRASESRRSDQGQVWDAIAAKARRLGVRSPTGAMSDIFDRHADDLERYVRAIPAQPGQVGAIFLIDGAVAGMELFATAATLARMLPKLVRSYALDAIETAGRGTTAAPSPAQGEAFLKEVAAAAVERWDGVGLGQEIRIEGDDVVGAGLVVEGEVVHFAAFRREPAAWPGSADGDGAPGDPIWHLGRFARARARRSTLERAGGRRRSDDGRHD